MINQYYSSRWPLPRQERIVIGVASPYKNVPHVMEVEQLMTLSVGPAKGMVVFVQPTRQIGKDRLSVVYKAQTKYHE